VRLRDPQTKRDRCIGYFASEDDAARAYDRAAVQMHGPGAKRNLPDGAIGEPPQPAGGERKKGEGGKGEDAVRKKQRRC
jgi:hypothetical protein